MKYQRIIKRYYNMIEVVLAMGIVAIGMTSIMVLFPVGINASRDAVAYNTSVEMGSNLISYMQAFAKGSPNNYDGLFIGASALNDSLLTGLTAGSHNDTSMITINGMSNNFVKELQPSGGSVPINSSSNFEKKATGIYQKKSASAIEKKVFFIFKGNVDANGDPTVNTKYDFIAMAILWKSIVKIDDSTMSSTADSTYGKIAGLNLEISWPLALNYNEREKQYLYVELTRPEYSLGD